MGSFSKQYALRSMWAGAGISVTLIPTAQAVGGLHCKLHVFVSRQASQAEATCPSLCVDQRR
jgi:hypothetical protein